jgi:hypothetical protein
VIDWPKRKANKCRLRRCFESNLIPDISFGTKSGLDMYVIERRIVFGVCNELQITGTAHPSHNSKYMSMQELRYFFNFYFVFIFIFLKTDREYESSLQYETDFNS